MINVLGLALYGPKAASHRVRLANYRQGLLERGINLEVQSLLNDDYVAKRFEGRRRPLVSVLMAGVERAILLSRRRRFHVVILHCELLPFAPAWLEEVLLRIPYIYDFDDAFYLRYRLTDSKFLRFMLDDKFIRTMTLASAVTAGNTNLASYARSFNSDVFVLPSVIDTKHFFPGGHCNNPIFTVGWIGSPSTAKYLQLLVGPLGLLGSEIPIRFIVIGAKSPCIDNIEIVEIPWSESTEVDLIRKFDVGVMPLPDDEWTRGKCAFKLIQYMACGVPVVASRVGANIELVTAKCGFLVDSAEQWVNALRELRNDAVKRNRMGLASRKRVVEAYSLESNLPLLENVIRKVV